MSELKFEVDQNHNSTGVSDRAAALAAAKVRWKNSAHESAHSCVALLLNIPFDFVMLDESGGMLEADYPSRSDAFNYACMNAAGLVVSHYFDPEHSIINVLRGEGADDFLGIRQLLLLHLFGSNKPYEKHRHKTQKIVSSIFWSRVLPVAVAMVHDHLEEIRAIALALYKAGKLQREEVQEIVLSAFSSPAFSERAEGREVAA